MDVDAAASVASARAPYPPYVAGLHSPIDVEQRFFNEWALGVASSTAETCTYSRYDSGLATRRI